MKLPIDIRDIMNTGNRINEEREKELRIAVFVDVEAPDALVDAVQEALRPQTSSALLHVEACGPGETLIIDSSADAVVAVAGPGATLTHSLASAREKFVPTVVLAVGERADAASRRLGQPLLDTIAAEEPGAAIHALGAWFTQRLSSKRLALANNFAFIRRAVAEESVKATSFQNGVIGFVAIIPGADMPLMTANQIKMVLQIAAAYGEPLGAERIKELAVVVGGGFTLRAIARQLLDFVPGFGWILKGAIGYSGTMAMGYAALEYFEEGGDVHALGDRLREAREKAIEAARARVSRGEPADEPIPANAYVVVEDATPPALAGAAEGGFAQPGSVAASGADAQ